MYDLDIKRILFETEELKEKCFFITHSAPPKRSTEVILSKFGNIAPIGNAKFADIVKSRLSTYSPIQIDVDKESKIIIK